MACARFQLGCSGALGIDVTRSTASISSARSPLRSSPKTIATSPFAAIRRSAASLGDSSGLSGLTRAVVPMVREQPAIASGRFVQTCRRSSKSPAWTATRRAVSRSDVCGSTTAQREIPAQRNARAAAPRFCALRGLQRTTFTAPRRSSTRPRLSRTACARRRFRSSRSHRWESPRRSAAPGSSRRWPCRPRRRCSSRWPRA